MSPRAHNASVSLTIVIFHVSSIWSTNVFSGRTNTESILCALCFSMHSVPHFVPSFPVFVFWITDTRLVPPAVKEAYCILHRRRMYTLHVELAARRSGVFNDTFLRSGSDERQWSGRIRQLDSSLANVILLRTCCPFPL